jgi:hypothetical protein
MAIVKWRKQAWRLFNNYVENAKVEEFDKKVAKLKTVMPMT